MTPSRWDRLKNNQRVLAAVFLLPTLFVLVSVVLYPFLSAVWISFQAKQAGTPGRFIGFRNYAELLGNPVFLQIAGNTVFYTGVAVAIKFTLGLAAALVLAPVRPLNALYRTILFVPWAVPTVIAALNWRWVYDEFSGMLNHVLLALGLTTRAFRPVPGPAERARSCGQDARPGRELRGVGRARSRGDGSRRGTRSDEGARRPGSRLKGRPRVPRRRVRLAARPAARAAKTEPLGHPPRRCARLGEHHRFADPRRAAAAQHDPPVDQHRVGGRPVPEHDELVRGIDAGPELHRVALTHDEVGALPRLEAADEPVEPGGARGAERRHLDGVLRGDRLAHLGRQMDRQERRVTDRALARRVGAEGDAHAPAPISGIRVGSRSGVPFCR